MATDRILLATNSLAIGRFRCPPEDALVAWCSKLFGPPSFEEGGFPGWRFGDGLGSSARTRQ